MATMQQRLDFSRRKGAITVSGAVLAALDHLTVEERDSIWQALDELEEIRPGPMTSLLERLPGEDSLYLLRPAPRVLLFLTLAPDGSGLVRHLVRPETLRMFEPLAAEPEGR